MLFIHDCASVLLLPWPCTTALLCMLPFHIGQRTPCLFCEAFWQATSELHPPWLHLHSQGKKGVWVGGVAYIYIYIIHTNMVITIIYISHMSFFFFIGTTPWPLSLVLIARLCAAIGDEALPLSAADPKWRATARVDISQRTSKKGGIGWL